MATVTVDNAKLVLNAFAATFQNNLKSADLVQWKKFDSEMNDRNALTVVEQVGPRYAVTHTTSAVNDLSSGVQDSVFGSEQFTVKDIFGSSMGWADFVKVRDIGDARESIAIKNAAQNLAETIDSYFMSVMATAANNWVGTAGNAVDSLGDVLSGYTRLKEEGVTDEDLRMVLPYSDKQALAETIVAYPATDSLSTGAFRRGFEGEIGGIPTIFTQQLQNFTTGSRAGGGSSAALINGAAQNVNYKDVAVSTAPGRYLTQTIAIDTLTGSQTLKKGDVFTIAGVNAWDNRAGQTLGRLQQFVVVDDATASTGAIASLRIFPAMIVPGSGSGGDVNVNTAHATVDAAPADNAAITFVGTASTAYKPRLILSNDAFVASTADLITPATGTHLRKSLTKFPMSVRMWKHSDFATGAHSIRFDVAVTLNIHERRRVLRVNGS